jgi:2'-5' RNA ligase
MSWYKTAKKIKCSGWTAIRMDSKMSKRVQDWGNKHITEDILYNKQKEDGKATDFGREVDTHITLVYGICVEDPDIIKRILKDAKPIKVILKKVGFFAKDDDYDVVIIKIESKDLEKLNEKINYELNVQSSFSEYHPHCTIAYVQKGCAMRFAGDTYFEGTKITFDKVVFVNNNDEETVISLK